MFTVVVGKWQKNCLLEFLLSADLIYWQIWNVINTEILNDSMSLCYNRSYTHAAIKWFQNAGFLWITLLNTLNTWPLNLPSKWGRVTNLIHRLVWAVFWPKFYMHFSCFLCMIHDTPWFLVIVQLDAQIPFNILISIQLFTSCFIILLNFTSYNMKFFNNITM